MAKKFLIIQGFIRRDEYDNGSPPYQTLIDGETAEDTVFIFPGNTSHNEGPQALYRVKVGGGLAAVACYLGQQGIPTLSLPTTGMNLLDPSRLVEVREGAISDLWYAIGLGKNLALPVRDPMLDKNTGQQIYFSKTFDNGLEPSFWGAIETTPNLSLADRYFNALETIMKYMKSEDKNDIPKDFIEAFQQGQQDANAKLPNEQLQRRVEAVNLIQTKISNCGHTLMDVDLGDNVNFEPSRQYLGVNATYSAYSLPRALESTIDVIDDDAAKPSKLNRLAHATLRLFSCCVPCEDSSSENTAYGERRPLL